MDLSGFFNFTDESVGKWLLLCDIHNDVECVIDDDKWLCFSDPRTNDWPLVKSPLPVTIILFGYLYVVLRWGPRYMAGKAAYDLKGFIWYYNLFQIVANAWIIFASVKAGVFTELTFGCEPCNYSPEGWPQQVWHFILVTIGVIIIHYNKKDPSYTRSTPSIAFQ